MIDRAFARTFGNFSTIFVIVAVVVFPLHLVHAFVFRDVIAASDYHAAIAAMPAGSRIGSVAPSDLTTARLVYWLLVAIELALLFFALRATRRALQVDDEGGVPTATDAWAHAFRAAGPGLALRDSLGTAAVGLAAALVCALLIAGIGGAITSFFNNEHRWVGEALTQALARAGGLPLFLGPIGATRAKEKAPPAPKLY